MLCISMCKCADNHIWHQVKTFLSTTIIVGSVRKVSVSNQ